jgi:hypothetical protein
MHYRMKLWLYFTAGDPDHAICLPQIRLWPRHQLQCLENSLAANNISRKSHEVTIFLLLNSSTFYETVID